MNISNETLDILRNFSSINSGITVKAGNELVTVSAMKNIFAKAVVDESFEKDHSIYDLSEYLGAVSLFDRPNFDFNAEKVTVSEGDNSVTYYYADPQMVISPTKEITMPEPEVSFDLDKDVLDSLLKASELIDSMSSGVGFPDSVLYDLFSATLGDSEIQVIESPHPLKLSQKQRQKIEQRQRDAVNVEREQRRE